MQALFAAGFPVSRPEALDLAGALLALVKTCINIMCALCELQAALGDQALTPVLGTRGY